MVVWVLVRWIERRAGSHQRGQTLIMFALVAAFLLFAMLALVGDYGITLNHYNAIDEAVVLGAQAGAAQINVPAFVADGSVVLNQGAAVAECERVARVDAPFVPAGQVTCTATATYVDSHISDNGQLVVRLLGDQFHIQATHRSRPAYGTTIPCQGPCP